MKIVVNSQNLAAELRLLNKVVPTKPAIAILSHALLVAGDDGEISFHATDMEVALTGPCAGKVEEPGSTAVPVEKLLQMVEQFPDDSVTLEASGQHLHVECGDFSSKLNALPVEDFPTLPSFDGTSTTIDAGTLRSLIAKTRHALNASGTKHVLKGSLLTFVGETVAMVTTDGRRLALATAARQGEDLDVVVPAKALDVLSGGSDEGEMTLTSGPRHLFFASGGRLLTSRKLEGKFPAYQSFVPTDNDAIVYLDRNRTAAALKRVTLTAVETSAVYLQIQDNRMTLSSASAGIGSAKEGVNVSYEGPPLKAYINGTFMLDFLAAANGQQVTLALKSDGGPSAIMNDGDHLGVISLMRTK